MLPLRLVHPSDLKVRKTYLIQEKRPEYAHLKSKGVFVKNDYPALPHYCTISHFTNVQNKISNGAKMKQSATGYLRLQDFYWNYYEADAMDRAYVREALRVITGDSEFIFDNY